MTADTSKILDGTIYILSERKRDEREIAAYITWFLGNEIPVEHIICITDIDEITMKTYVLIEGDYAYVASCAAILTDRGMEFDYAGNWLGHEIDTKYLEAMRVREYVDLYQNKIIIAKKIPAGIIVTRCVRRHRIAAYHNAVRIGSVRYVIRSLSIIINGTRGYVRVSDGCSFRSCDIEVGTRGQIILGKDVMVSSSVVLFGHDGHLIFDKNTGKRINAAKKIIVGNHVWIGRAVMLLGGAVIPDNCVLGAHSVTSKKFEEKNAIIAGSPAKIVRRGILWARDSTEKDYQRYEECSDQEALRYMDKEQTYVHLGGGQTDAAEEIKGSMERKS